LNIHFQKTNREIVENIKSRPSVKTRSVPLTLTCDRLSVRIGGQQEYF